MKEENIPIDELLSFADFEKMPLYPISHACFEALDAFQMEQKRLPLPWNLDDVEKFVKFVELIAKDRKVEWDEKWNKFSRLF